MTDAELQAEAKRLIDALGSTPRFAGSAEEESARLVCESELRSSGFSVAERAFEFSQWPGRWGIHLISGGLFLGIVVVAVGADRSWRVGWLAFLLVVALGNRIVRSVRNSATRKTPWLRTKAVNIEAARGEPRLWLVAHLDTKSQSIPMLVRVTSHVSLLAVLAIETIALVLSAWRSGSAIHWNWFVMAGAIAAVPSLLCFVGNKSPGALDNATGVAAVLVAARLVPPERSLGILITSGEELDLAGARAWAETPGPGAVMLNCDTIDEKGDWRCIYAKGPNVPAAAAERAAKKLGLALRMGRVIPGIITDSLAFETAGLPSVTVSRGSLRTLARLHTAGDKPDSLSGAGAATAARLLAKMVEELS